MKKQVVVFITVGTTEFNGLIDSLHSNSVIEAIARFGCAKLILQIGNGNEPNEETALLCKQHKIELEFFRFKPSLREYFVTADLIIGHAGAGTVIEVLKMNKKLIICVNDELQENHQSELAEALSAQGYCCMSGIQSLSQTIDSIASMTMKPRPLPDHSIFPRMMNEAVFGDSK